MWLCGGTLVLIKGFPKSLFTIYRTAQNIQVVRLLQILKQTLKINESTPTCAFPDVLKESFVI